MIVALAIVNAFVVATGERNSCTGSILCCGLAQSDCDGFARSVRSSLVVDTSLAAPSVPLECAPYIEGYSCWAPYKCARSMYVSQPLFSFMSDQIMSCI
jgi:hypothetical protein